MQPSSAGPVMLGAPLLSHALLPGHGTKWSGTAACGSLENFSLMLWVGGDSHTCSFILNSSKSTGLAKLTKYQQERAKDEVVKLGENGQQAGPGTVDSRPLLMSVKSEDFWGEVSLR